jgi:hypothetical protein
VNNKAAESIRQTMDDAPLALRSLDLYEFRDSRYQLS